MSARRSFQRIAFGALLGAITAVLGTVFHQAWVQGFPYGLALAFGVILWCLIELRKNKSRLSAWVYVVCLTGLIFLFAQRGTDVMIPANFAGYTWSYGSIGFSFLVAAFPKMKR